MNALYNTEWDVIICGGGPAGLAAAMQAGHADLKVLLIEKSGMLGGTTSLNGVSLPGLFHAWGRQVIAGYGWDLVRRSVEVSGGKLPDFSDFKQRHWKLQVPVDRAIYAALADEAVLASGTRILLHTLPVACRREDGQWTVTVAGKSGLRELRSRYVLDCTGDANVATMAGAKIRRSGSLQPATLMFKLGGYDFDRLDVELIAKNFEAAVGRGLVEWADLSLHAPNAVKSFLRCGGQNRMHITGIDASDSEGKTQLELAARRILLRLIRFFGTQPGLENLCVEYCASECGVRETATVIGELTISEDDYTSGRIWEDSLCYSFYPVDIHRADGNGIDIRPLREGVVATVPLRALKPVGLTDFYVAGRCVSSDQAANSALRVQASAMAMGQAAAAAIATAAHFDCSDIVRIKTLLHQHGAIVPEVRE